MAKTTGQKAAPQSTISRLESKYSDILDRVAKRKQRQQQEKDDRDKTIEPDYRSNMPAPLMKSQTTANVTRSDKIQPPKERTPFRFDRNKSKYSSDVDVKIKRSELIGLSTNNNANASNYHDSYTKMKSNDSGYYDGYRGYGKENIYKSKYDPDVLLSEMSSSNGTKRTTTTTPTAQQQQPYAGSSTSRQIKSYKRAESGEKRRTAINLYELLNDEDSEVNNGHQRRYQYTQRKSTGNQLRLDNQRRDLFDVDEDLEKTERENKRKEIQSLIMKYAQMDDFYGKSSGYNHVETERERDRERDDNNNRPIAKVDPWDRKHSPIVIPKKSANPLGKSQTMANIPGVYDSNGSTFSSWYPNYSSNNIVPIKTNAMTPSSSKSRMSKALSTFVRFSNSEIWVPYLLLVFCDFS